MAELVPYPIAALATRMFRELERDDRVFDLPRSKFFTSTNGKDLSVRFHGRRAATPLGPAAGPQSQMAQNLVLSWLGGCRIMELKTVQIDDELVIPRPCIDMRTVGYNVEWSQELKLEQSLEEYVKGALLIEMLRASDVLDLPQGLGDVIQDMSVGYDLGGIRSPRVLAFLDGMRDCSAVLEKLRGELPSALGDLRDVEVPAELSSTLTLSTFHGCPPDEIEAIMRFLLEERRLNAIVKLNPMLLGPKEARGLLHDGLGYQDISIPDSAFERDTTWPQAVDFVGRLGDLADSLGLGFGVKFTNTLIVENRGDYLPADVKEQYLSGRPLHVLAMHLVKRFRQTFGDRFPISFSAGIERSNFPDAVALGLVPVTVCSDLLRPGGYGRAKGYLDELVRRMDAVGAADLDAWRSWGDTDAYVDGLVEDERYRAPRNAKPPRKIGSHLELFDCITCDKCIPVCPNDANFALAVAPMRITVRKLVRDGEAWREVIEGEITLDEKHQIANLADFCNECGNCDVFCPEDGGPYVVKPRFFRRLDDWRRFATHDGFHVTRDVVHGRFDGVEYVLRGDAYEGPDFVHRGMDGIEGRASTIDLTFADIMRVVRDAVLDGPVNGVNTAT